MNGRKLTLRGLNVSRLERMMRLAPKAFGAGGLPRTSLAFYFAIAGLPKCPRLFFGGVQRN